MDPEDLDIEYLEDEKDVEGLIRLLKSSDYLTRKEAARSLRKVGDARAVNALIDSLRYRSWHSDYIILSSVRENSAEALGAIGDSRAIPFLIEAMEEDPDEEVRLKAAWALGEIGDPEATEALINALHDSRWSVRRNAANALGVIGDHRAVPSLIEALGDRDWHVRKYAAVSLGKLKDERALPVLVEALHDEDADVRWKAMIALGKLGEKAVPPLIKTLRKESWRVRAKAAEVLGKIGGEEALEALICLLHGKHRDKNRHVRGRAAEALGRIGDKRALEALEEASNDEYSYVREKALRSIDKIYKPREEIRLLNYDNGEVSFDYTSEWEITSSPSEKKVARGQYANSSITLSINRKTDLEDITSEDFANLLKDVFRVQGSTITDEQEFEKDGMEGFQIIGKNDRVTPTRILIVSFKKDDLLYYMWFVGDPIAFEEAEDDIDLMLDSFYIYG